MFDLYKTIVNIIDQASKVEFNEAELFIALEFENTLTRDQYAAQLASLETEKNRNTLRIHLNQPEFWIFADIDDFNKRIKKDDVKDDNFRKNIFILKQVEKTPLVYLSETKGTYENFYQTNNNYLFENTLSYYKLLEFLKKQEHKEDRHFYFVDYFNSDHRRIIITSLKKEGKLTIGYLDSVPTLNYKISITQKISHFIESFNEKQLPKFLKAELFNVLPTYKQENRLVAFIDNLEFIQERAEQNFEIYLSDLSLDVFKNEFLEFRLKYFNQLRDILSKITTQILAFPLSITASAFATYKVVDSVFLCSIIVVAFVLFGIYSLFMLKAHRDDVKEIKKLFENDYNSFSKNEFFNKYPNELESFKGTYDYIQKRSDLLIRCIDIYSFVLIATNSLFVSFILFQFVNLKIAIILGVIVLIVLLLLEIIAYYWLK